ncbi:MAG: 2-polyprenyl-3-methyl-6-methoxy-1,4-benzoquinone monooxygenase [Gammaproteobacteria bacterium]|nr:2-polyprenyl-3-methyl-6-methoxy-1,4-benzoquinone monooxygenase [Gammaproteobacteria bacterium]
MRNYSRADKLLIEVDQALRTVHGRQHSRRPNPSATSKTEGESADTLPASARRLSRRLLRVDHAGEVAAQGLYQGQALTARDVQVREQMRHSAAEENDHLAWCHERILELGGRRSVFGPCWYLGSYALGAAAGLAGDRWSLGFVSETEHQVVRHLEDHLRRLSAGDHRSHAILAQMKVDEGQHAEIATRAGGQELPGAFKQAMTLVSKVMTRTAYWL